MELGTIRAVIEVRIPDLLQSAGDKGVTLKELSEKSGIEEGKLGRIMRYLATKHVFREGELQF